MMKNILVVACSSTQAIEVWRVNKAVDREKIMAVEGGPKSSGFSQLELRVIEH